jgi:hypothetical protein
MVNCEKAKNIIVLHHNIQRLNNKNQDDTCVSVSGDNIHEIQTKFSHVLNSLNLCFTRNGLSLNMKKTNVLIFETINHGNIPLQL